MKTIRGRVVVAYVMRGCAGHVDRIASLAREMPDSTIFAVADAPDAEQHDRLSRLSADLPNVGYLRLDVALGKGAAMRAGLNAAPEPVVVLLDLDGSVESKLIDDYCRALETDPLLDAVIGNRWSRDSKIDAGSKRRTASWAFDLFARGMFGLRTADPQSPLKVFRRRALLRVFDELRLYNHGFDVELVFQSERAQLKIEERPIDWVAIPHAWPLVATGAQAATALLTVRLLNSPLSRVWLLGLLGRRYSLPVKRSYSILIFCWRDPRNPLGGGGEVYLQEQARHWVRQGHSVTWFAQRFEGSKAEEDVDGIHVVRRGRFPFVFLLGGLWYIFKSDKRFDFMIDCMNGIPFFTPAFSTKPKVCLIYHVHSHHFDEELPRPVGTAARFFETKLVPVLYRNTRFLTISENTRNEMNDLAMSRLPIGLIYSGVDERLVPGKKADVPTVLYLGRLKRYKGVRKLIDAFAVAKRTVSDARLVIAGAGDDDEPLREYAAAVGCGGIEFAGRVSDDDKLRLMQEAWVFGMPSTIEGWGIVVIEANACATPAIVYDVSALRDCVVDGGTGFKVQDDDEYARRLLELLTDARMRDRMSEAAREWSTHFSWASTAEKTLEQIRQAQPWCAVFEPPGENVEGRLTLRANAMLKVSEPA